MIDAGQNALVVDDDSRTRLYIKTVLRSAGFQVSEARDGLEGLEIFQASNGTLDIVITDIRMPRMTGSEFAFRLRVESAVPLIFISGEPEPAYLNNPKNGFVFI